MTIHYKIQNCICYYNIKKYIGNVNYNKKSQTIPFIDSCYKDSSNSSSVLIKITVKIIKDGHSLIFKLCSSFVWSWGKT